MGVSTGALPPLLLAALLSCAPGALGASPGLVARITDKGLEYGEALWLPLGLADLRGRPALASRRGADGHVPRAVWPVGRREGGRLSRLTPSFFLPTAAKEGLEALQRELHRIELPDFAGDFKIKPFGSGHYEFCSLQILSCELHGASLKPLPGQGLAFSVSNSNIKVQGRWKARKSFVKLHGSFDMEVKGITISFNLLLGKDSSGRPTVTASSCRGYIRDVDVDMSGNVGWLLNLFHNQIESKFRRELESKGEIFNHSHDHHSRVALLPPVMNLPEEHSRMVYFTISNYVFNTASLVYQKAGYLSFSITDDLIPPDSNIRLTTKSFRSFAPRLARLYPNMNLELQGAVVSAPLLNFSPANLSLAPELEIEGFVLSSSGRVELLEAFLNFYIVNNFYPTINEQLANGFPLPLLKHIQLYDLILQIYKTEVPRKDAVLSPAGDGVHRGFTSSLLFSVVHVSTTALPPVHWSSSGLCPGLAMWLTQALPPQRPASLREAHPVDLTWAARRGLWRSSDWTLEVSIFDFLSSTRRPLR
ncbi:Lipopolysaccharide-binding protein [Galemys pyrenaicus]|uniref:Lipopolysaccharide-binding protein n=1 Tax=Galemys pyrenaicus TaxID=202257 RepID=A0A8J6AAD6_GALPY|nr:Lipopolysaccharide-binding protein [Galemys pyrenaicus]